VACAIGRCVALYFSLICLSNRNSIQVFHEAKATFSASKCLLRSAIFNGAWSTFGVRPMTGIGLHDWLKPDLDAHTEYRQFFLAFHLQCVFLGLPAFVFFSVPSGYGLATLALGRKIFRGTHIATIAMLAWVLMLRWPRAIMTTCHLGCYLRFRLFRIRGGPLDVGRATYSPHDEYPILI